MLGSIYSRKLAAQIADEILKRDPSYIPSLQEDFDAFMVVINAMGKQLNDEVKNKTYKRDFIPASDAVLLDLHFQPQWWADMMDNALEFMGHYSPDFASAASRLLISVYRVPMNIHQQVNWHTFQSLIKKYVLQK